MTGFFHLISDESGETINWQLGRLLLRRRFEHRIHRPPQSAWIDVEAETVSHQKSRNLVWNKRRCRSNSPHHSDSNSMVCSWRYVVRLILPPSLSYQCADMRALMGTGLRSGCLSSSDRKVVIAGKSCSAVEDLRQDACAPGRQQSPWNPIISNLVSNGGHMMRR